MEKSLKELINELTNELEKSLGCLTSDPLFQAMAGEVQHEANEETEEGEGCDCCDYYAFSDGDSPDGDI